MFAKNYTEPNFKQCMDHRKLEFIWTLFLNTKPTDIQWLNYSWKNYSPSPGRMDLIVALLFQVSMLSLLPVNFHVHGGMFWDFNHLHAAATDLFFYWWRYRGEGERNFSSKAAVWTSKVELVTVGALSFCTIVLYSCSSYRLF